MKDVDYELIRKLGFDLIEMKAERRGIQKCACAIYGQLQLLLL